MKNNKKLQATALAGIVAAGLLAGCGSSQTQGSNGGSSSNGQPVKITIWTNARADSDLMQAKIDNFNKTNKDHITVDYRIMTDNYEQALQTAIQGGDSPDLFNAKMTLQFDSLVKMNAIEPLNNYLTPAMKTEFGSMLNVEHQNSLNGKTYSLPNYGTTYRLIYNKDLFAQAGISGPPKSVAEMVADAKKITDIGKANGQYGFAINLKTPSLAFDRALLPMLRLDGNDIYDWKNGKWDFTAVKPYISAFKQMVDDKSMFPGYESLDIDPLRNQFAAGKIGMYLSQSAEPAVYSSQFPTKINWGVAQVPTLDGTQPYKGANYIVNGAVWFYMSSQSQHKQQAWEVMQYLYSDDVLVPYYEQGKGVTMVPSVMKQAKAPTLPNFQDFAPKDDAMWPAYPVFTVTGKSWQSTLAESIMGITPIDQAISNLNKQYNADFDNAVKSNTTQRYQLPDFDPRKLIAK